jgi:hypothetical protein
MQYYPEPQENQHWESRHSALETEQCQCWWWHSLKLVSSDGQHTLVTGGTLFREDLWGSSREQESRVSVARRTTFKKGRWCHREAWKIVVTLDSRDI